MRLLRYTLAAILLAIFGVAIYQTLLWFGVWGNVDEPQVMALEGADQEIALIEPATSTDDWGRLVTALQLLEIDWPNINAELPTLSVDLERAFPLLTSDLPEVVFSLGNSPGKLRLRWYKISAENDTVSWVRKLRARARQPLAVLGGGTTDRAIKLARTLVKAYGKNPAQPSPVLLLTTATSEKTKKGDILIQVYPERTFRFSFTNQKMVESLLAFVQHREPPAQDPDWARNLWVGKADDQATTPAPGPMHSITWEDERYSLDMAYLFEKAFEARFPKSHFTPEGTIKYSLGGFFHAAPEEQAMVGSFLARPTPLKPHSLLLLPTQAVRMRGFLVNLRQRSPADARNLVVLNGDAISFNSVYRDREVVWNILDLPYSLVFFSHRNPIDHAAGFTWTKGNRAANTFPQQTTTGTQDVLLYRDIFEAFLYAATDHGALLDDPLRVRDRLQKTCWHRPTDAPAKARVCNPLVHAQASRPFFDAEGNRQSHTGEHIVWVKPNFTDDRVDLVSKISVWDVRPGADGGAWRLVEAFDATYNQSRMEEAQ